MIYFFTWNSDYLVKQQVFTWKTQFITKYGDFNCVDIKNITDVDNNFIAENISAGSFLSEKKLIIISLDGKIDESKENFLLKIIDSVSSDNIVLFHKLNPDKRTKFIKNLISKSTHKEFISDSEDTTAWIIKNKFWDKISHQAINEIIKYKSNNIWKIIPEIEKLLISFDFIDTKEVKQYIFPELEASIFECIEAILQKNIKQSISLIDIILEQTSVYGLYASLLANLRNTLYISYLKAQKIPASQITTILELKNKSFLVNKQYKISYRELKTMYLNLVNLDKQNKSWKLLDGKESDFAHKIIEAIIKV